MRENGTKSPLLPLNGFQVRSLGGLELVAVQNRFRGMNGSLTGVSEMDWNRIEGNWKQMKGKVKEQWGKLTNDDLDVIAGHRDQLEGKIQERYGYAKDQVRKEIDDWVGRLH